MTHVQNNLPDEYDKILDGLEIHLTSSGFDALTTVVIHEKWNDYYKKIKNKNEENKFEEKTLLVYGKQCLGNKNEDKDEKKEHKRFRKERKEKVPWKMFKCWKIQTKDFRVQKSMLRNQRSLTD